MSQPRWMTLESVSSLLLRFQIDQPLISPFCLPSFFCYTHSILSCTHSQNYKISKMAAPMQVDEAVPGDSSKFS